MSCWRTERRSLILSEHNACPHCEISFPELEPSLFSFNSPSGMCPTCNGLGAVERRSRLDRLPARPEPARRRVDLVGRAARQGALVGAATLAPSPSTMGVDLELPWNELPERFRQILLYGSGEERFRYIYSRDNEQRQLAAEVERPVQRRGAPDQPPVSPDQVANAAPVLPAVYEQPALPHLPGRAPLPRGALCHRGRQAPARVEHDDDRPDCTAGSASWPRSWTSSSARSAAR